MKVLDKSRSVAAQGGATALSVARAGLLQWFSVNLYEAVVRMPDKLAAAHDDPTRPRRRGPLAPGSPARYHLPAAALVLGSLAAALLAGRQTGRRRLPLAIGAASGTAAAGLTGYLVRSVNLRLLDDGPPLGDCERERLVHRWHAVNRVRLGILAVGYIALTRAAGRD